MLKEAICGNFYCYQQMTTEQKSNLTNAFDRIRALNLETNTTKYIELNNILCDLSNQQFEKGLDIGVEIIKKVYKL